MFISCLFASAFLNFLLKLDAMWHMQYTSHHVGSSSNIAQFGQQVQFQCPLHPKSSTTNIEFYGPPQQHVCPISLPVSVINLHQFSIAGKYFFSGSLARKYFFSKSIANVWYFNNDTIFHISSNSYHALL